MTKKTFHYFYLILILIILEFKFKFINCYPFHLNKFKFYSSNDLKNLVKNQQLNSNYLKLNKTFLNNLPLNPQLLNLLNSNNQIDSKLNQFPSNLINQPIDQLTDKENFDQKSINEQSNEYNNKYDLYSDHYLSNNPTINELMNEHLVSTEFGRAKKRSSIKNLIFNQKQSLFLKKPNQSKISSINKLTNSKPKLITVNLSSLASLPPLPFLTNSLNEDIINDQTFDIYDDLRFYLIINLNENQLNLIHEIAEQKNDLIDLVCKTELKSILNNMKKLKNYLKLKDNSIVSNFELINQMTKNLPNNSKRILKSICRSTYSMELVLRMFIINEWINKQSNKVNYFDFNNKNEFESNLDNKIKLDFLNRICYE